MLAFFAAVAAFFDSVDEALFLFLAARVVLPYLAGLAGVPDSW